MRKLNTADVFAMARIVRASGLRDDLREVILRVSEKGLSTAAVGIDGMLVVMEAVAEKKAESAIYEALAGPFEIPAADIATMELDVLLDNLKQLAEANDLKRFFDLVSRILGKK